MSIAARAQLCSRLVFQDEAQRADLMDPAVTQTTLIALLLEVTAHTPLEVTAVKSDHHDDSALGEHCHFRGFAADLWPLASLTPGDYLDASDARFGAFLRALAASPWLYQIGLAGEANTDANLAAAGASSFVDDGGDHVHVGAA